MNLITNDEAIQRLLDMIEATFGSRIYELVSHPEGKTAPSDSQWMPIRVGNSDLEQSLVVSFTWDWYTTTELTLSLETLWGQDNDEHGILGPVTTQKDGVTTYHNFVVSGLKWSVRHRSLSHAVDLNDLMLLTRQLSLVAEIVKCAHDVMIELALEGYTVGRLHKRVGRPVVSVQKSYLRKVKLYKVQAAVSDNGGTYYGLPDSEELRHRFEKFHKDAYSSWVDLSMMSESEVEKEIHTRAEILFNREGVLFTKKEVADRVIGQMNRLLCPGGQLSKALWPDPDDLTPHEWISLWIKAGKPSSY